MILIIGASGYIGRNLFQRFREESYDVVGTYAQHPREGLIHFDLETSSLADLPQKPDYVFLCSVAYHSLDDSKRYWERAYSLDVIQIKRILDYCFAHNIIPLYFSSDNVFDGAKGNYIESDARNPITGYGRLKFEVENYLLSSGKPGVILRMGKVFGVTPGDNTLITTMVSDLVIQRKKIQCATDQLISPLFINDLFYFTKKIIDEKITGVYHLTSLIPLTRYNLARSIINFFNLDNNLASPCEFRNLKLLDQRPNLIDLNDEKSRELTRQIKVGLPYYLGEIKKNLFH